MTWQNTLTIAERKSLLLRAVSEADEQTALDRGRKKLCRWQELGVLSDAPTLAARLASDALQHDEFLYLLGAPAGSAAPGGADPEWLADLKDIYASGTDCSDLTALRQQEPALGLVAPLVQHGKRMLVQNIGELPAQFPHPPFDPDSVSAIMMPGLIGRLKASITPTLVQQLNVDRILGKLDGDTPARRYENFLASIWTHDRAAAILSDYPVLAKFILAATRQWLEASMEFLTRLCEDWQNIRKKFELRGTDRLVRYQAGAGDPHNSGRSVAIVGFSSGLKLVYKPRPVSVDRHFQELVKWLNDRGDHRPFRTPAVMECGQYGWVEHVAARPCKSAAEVRDFYRQMGGWVALFYGLRAKDLHHENFIACGQTPVPVDVECLFQPALGHFGPYPASEDPARRLVEETVLQSDILPQRTWRSDQAAEGVDLGALDGPAGTLSAHRMPVMEQNGTDAIRLVRKRVRLPASNNTPNLNGASLKLADYGDEIVDGFEQVYRLLMDHRDSLLALEGPLQAFSQDQVRLIFISTQAYANLLNDGFHPHMMRDGLERGLLFDRLWNLARPSPRDVRLVRSEQSALERGDIPLFFTAPSSRNICAGSDVCIANGLELSGLDAVRQRIGDLTEADLVRQKWLITATVSSTQSSPRPRARIPVHDGAGGEPYREDCLDMACRIGDRLSALAFSDSKYVSWFEPVILSKRRTSIEPVGLSLYNGLPGITLFLAYLGKVSNQARYTELAQQGLATILRKLDCSAQAREGIGAFYGLAGIVYLYVHLAALWQRREELEQAQSLMPDIERQVADSQMFDIVGGSAGAILSLMALHAVNPVGGCRGTMESLGNHLADHANETGFGAGWRQPGLPVPLGGFSHGAGGIALALLTLDAVSGHRRFRDTAESALAYERSTFNPELENWRDLRQQSESYMTAWCHGAAGIALSRLAMLPYLDDSLVAEELSVALKTTSRHGPGRNHCLCHGALGNLEAFLLAGRLGGQAGVSTETLAQTVRRFVRGIFASISKDGWICGNRSGIEGPGLMTGLSGIGYQMLRLADPDRVPSVLVLEPPKLVTGEV